MAYSMARYSTPIAHQDPSWETRAATQRDCEWIVHKLPATTIDEIEATSRYKPVTALLQDLPNKKVICDTRRPLQPVALLYLFPNPDNPDIAGFWFAGTAGLLRSDDLASFGVYAASIVDHFNRVYPKLLACVDARNARQLDFLKQLGFVATHSLPQYGRKELPFHFLERKQSNV